MTRKSLVVLGAFGALTAATWLALRGRTTTERSAGQHRGVKATATTGGTDQRPQVSWRLSALEQRIRDLEERARGQEADHGKKAAAADSAESS